MLRRVGAIGDIHAEDELLAEVLSNMKGLDAVLAVGDITDGWGDVNRTIALLRENGVLAVRGNHDRWRLSSQHDDLPAASRDLDAASREFLEALPVTRRFETARGRLLLSHGLGENDMAGLRSHDEGYALESNLPLWRLLSDGAQDFVLFGHTHERMVRRIAPVTFINAGTLHRSFPTGFLIIEFSLGEVRCFDLGPTREAGVLAL
jgi:putative phosphoesterase